MNFSPGREDSARRHCSNAGLLKKQDQRGVIRCILHADPCSPRNEDSDTSSSIVVFVIQCDSHVAFVDEDYLIFVRLWVGILFAWKMSFEV